MVVRSKEQKPEAKPSQESQRRWLSNGDKGVRRMIHTFMYDGHLLQTTSDSDWTEIDAINRYERKKKAEEDKRKKEIEDFIRRIVREEIVRALNEQR